MKAHHLALPVFQTGRFPLSLCKLMYIRARPLELSSKDSRLPGPHHPKAWVPEKALDIHRILMAAGRLSGHAPGPVSCAPARGAAVQTPAPHTCLGCPPLLVGEDHQMAPGPTLSSGHLEGSSWLPPASVWHTVRPSVLRSTRSSQEQALGAPDSC